METTITKLKYRVYTIICNKSDRLLVKNSDFCDVFDGLAASDSRKFDAGFVDPWCSFPDVDDNNRFLRSELTRYMYCTLGYTIQ